ncbi:hypothetical protein [Cerasicoccus frondis]|uniref:hypothetical protein n=1 Tax=Cerasicoccus frondis TaxID=490090 RepID=UPI0028527190|nr:hypothetical protein [Cerasicoccus frondis]
MGLVFPKNNIFARWPSVTELPEKLIIANTGIARKLGLHSHDVEIDFSNAQLSIETSSLWRTPMNTILPLSSIAYIEHSLDRPYDTTWGMASSDHGPNYLQDVFHVSVSTQEDMKHDLCVFIGRPLRLFDQKVTFNEPSPMLGSLIEQKHGTMDFGYDVQGMSFAFAKMLSERLGVPLGRHVDDDSFMVTCPACNCRTSRHKPKCIYCGAEWVAAFRP